MIPRSASHQLEHKYRLNREKYLNFFKFKNCHIEGDVCDFKIGDNKFQEKVGSPTINAKSILY